ncbi:MAG: WecB/TagA/CpsF family glycosyltransferase [Sphaerospermopsis sp. SIO1G2]|nr:WecB/TagA/CpsF family glycosyltransferase [Sphaerospermopsis sp. SIO1G2]
MEIQISEELHLENRQIISIRVDATNYEDATKRIISWSLESESKSVFAANVHMIMEAYDDPEFSQVVANTNLVTPDGMPLVWALKALGIKNSSRVYGPTLTLYVCKAAAEMGIPIGLYGGTTQSLQAFVDFLTKEFPEIKIPCQISPPFRPLTSEEDQELTQQIINSGIKILFVGIGCPKQEFWINNHKNKIPAVMLGVGAAFDFHSGRVKQAPSWMQNLGLEWLFRLIKEPKRLWKRYFKHNPRFILLFLKQLFLGTIVAR